MGNLTIAASKTYLITNITFQDRILRSENSARSKLELTVVNIFKVGPKLLRFRS